MEIPKLVRGSLPFSCERQLVSFLGENLTLKEVRSIDDDISISTYQIYQKIPNGIKFSICKMFAIDENVSFHKMFELMGPVCIVSIEIINRFLRNCFHLVDKEKLFEKKITFQSSNEVIGREYFNVIYCGTSYIHIKDDNSCDILHSDLINVASNLIKINMDFFLISW